MCYTSQTEAYFQSRESWSSSGAPEFQKSWWGQAYVVGKICPPPHCTSNVTVYEDILRSDGQVNESNNKIYHFLALEKLSKNPPSDIFFHIENSEKNVPKDSHLKATFWKTANLLLGFGQPLIF